MQVIDDVCPSERTTGKWRSSRSDDIVIGKGGCDEVLRDYLFSVITKSYSWIALMRLVPLLLAVCAYSQTGMVQTNCGHKSFLKCRAAIQPDVTFPNEYFETDPFLDDYCYGWGQCWGAPCNARLGQQNAKCNAPDIMNRHIDGKLWAKPSPQTCTSRGVAAKMQFDFNCPLVGETGVPCVVWANSTVAASSPNSLYYISSACDNYTLPVNTSMYTEEALTWLETSGQLTQAGAAEEPEAVSDDSPGPLAEILGVAAGACFLVAGVFWYQRSKKRRKVDKVRSSFGDTFDI